MKTAALPDVGAYYVEPYKNGANSDIFRIYGPFKSALEAFRAAFFMHSRDELYASDTEAFAKLVSRDFTFHEPGEVSYIFRYDGWHEMGYKKATFFPAEKVPVHVSWRREKHDRELAEHHVLNNANSAHIISKVETLGLYEEWRRLMKSKGFL